MGYLNRRCGLSCDNLLSVDVVTADGTFVTCSADREKDLFWAIRGGGNFGVVSRPNSAFILCRHLRRPHVLPLDGDVLRAYRDFILEAPEDLGALFGFTMASPLVSLPKEWHGPSPR
ncbi:hypothetical protein BH18ACI4_BH18ACI4_01550 [soil metagenome]